VGQAVQVQAEQRPVGWTAECLDPWEAGKRSTIPSRDQRFGARDGGVEHPFQLFGVAAAHPLLEQVLAGVVAGSALLTRKQIFLCFTRSNRCEGTGKRRNHRVGFVYSAGSVPERSSPCLVSGI
jgi:hypothetical protein